MNYPLIRPASVALLAGTLALSAWTALQPAQAKTGIDWQDWSPTVFNKAKAAHKFVLLDLEAVWCHWCHVMDAKTYANPQIAEYIQNHYIAVKADQDGHPALSNRYGDYGWPATVVFAADGSEIVKRRGYLPPPVMLSMLQAIVKDPSPGPSIVEQPEVSAASQAGLSKAQRKHLLATYNSFYDTKLGGWGNVHKLIDAPAVDYALLRAGHGDAAYAHKARQTLDAASKLIDPVWGGLYQYSDSGDWQHPHFEKIMAYQANGLRLYAEAYARWHDPKYRSDAKAIYSYLTRFLSAQNGGFYTSQSADLNHDIDGHKYYALGNKARRKLGIPPIDKHIYARENGWAIRALARYADTTGDTKALTRARKAAQFIMNNRGRDDGGFNHGAGDTRPYLGDSLAMGQALMALYRSTGERAYLKRAATALAFIDKTFRDDKTGGYITAIPGKNAAGVLKKPVRLVDENVGIVRFANLMHFYTGEAADRGIAEHAMRYLSSPTLAQQRPYLPGVLLANFQINHEPAHVTVVGHKDNAKSKALHAAARRYPADYMLVEWWDKREGPLPNPAINYPDLGKPAAFACANQSCSLPVFKPGKVAAAINRLQQRKPQQAAKR